jgi:hypothetical protein
MLGSSARRASIAWSCGPSAVRADRQWRGCRRPRRSARGEPVDRPDFCCSRGRSCGVGVPNQSPFAPPSGSRPCPPVPGGGAARKTPLWRKNVEPMGTQWEPIGECRGAIAEGGPQRRLRPASVEPQTEPILSHGMSGCRIRAVGARHRAFAVPGRIHRVHPIAPTAGVRCASSEPRPPAPSGRRAPRPTPGAAAFISCLGGCAFLGRGERSRRRCDRTRPTLPSRSHLALEWRGCQFARPPFDDPLSSNS